MVRVTPDGDVRVGPPSAAMVTATVVSDEVSPVELLNVVLKRRWFVARCTFWTGLFVGLVVYFWPYSYTVTVAFTPQGSTQSSSLAGLSGLAAQFGVAVPNLSGGPTPDLYVTLLTTPDFLRPAVNQRYKFRDQGANWDADYSSIYDINGNPGWVLTTALTQLVGQMTVSANEATGVVTVATVTNRAGLSLGLSKKFLAMVDSFNLAARQQQATELERFTTVRIEKSAAELKLAEDSLATFMQNNRNYQSAPFLVLEHDRLQRSITFKQSVYTTLVQTYEQARIDAARNTPSIVVVQPAMMPLQGDPKHGKVKLAVALVFGMALGIGWVLMTHVLAAGSPQAKRDMEELKDVMANIKSEVKGFPKRAWGWRRKPSAWWRSWRERRARRSAGAT